MSIDLNTKQDFGVAYIPKTDEAKFERDMKTKSLLSITNKSLYSDLALIPQEKGRNTFFVFLPTLTLMSYFSSKIALIGRIQSRYRRFGLLLTLNTFVFGSYLRYSLSDLDNQFEAEKIRIRHKYLKYRYTGDVRELNPEVNIISYFDV